MSANACQAKDKAPSPVPLGRFSGAPFGYVGRLIIDLSEGGAFRFRNVNSAHLPPRDLEDLSGTAKWEGDKLCLSPAPQAIEPCLRKASADQLVAVQKQDGKQVPLDRIK